MGRYYKFTVGNQTWSSQYNGKDDPGAPLIEMDINVAPADQGPQGSVTVWGIPLQLVSAQNQFYNKPFRLMGGMSPGLPLATSQSTEAGLLCSGTISGTFSTWETTTQYLGFTLAMTDSMGTVQPSPFAGSNTTPSRNLVLNWKKGQPLSGPLQQALQAAFPDDVPLDVEKREAGVAD
jgi:hypothetical protein